MNLIVSYFLNQIKGQRQLKDDVVYKGQYYCVSTVELPYPIGTFNYETMIFPYENGQISYIEEHCKRHVSKEEARAYHEYIILHLEQVL